MEVSDYTITILPSHVLYYAYIAIGEYIIMGTVYGTIYNGTRCIIEIYNIGIRRNVHIIWHGDTNTKYHPYTIITAQYRCKMCFV